ncbi:MAG: Uma2 family endonuclease [Armatimonadetes bacterium]|nr:Uma2 family endonuclease [Armatimonadota bacterium]
MAVATRMTGEELRQLPDDGRRYELVGGELVAMTPPGGSHGERALRIGRLLDEFVEEHGLGWVAAASGVYLAHDPDTVRGPDVLFISRERLGADVRERLGADVEVTGYYDVVPDLVVEVVSPGDTDTETIEKVGDYLRAGVRLVWVVDIRTRRVTLHPGAEILSAEDTLTGGDVLPGFAVPVSRLFQR